MRILYHLVGGQAMPLYAAHQIVKPEIDIFLYTSGSAQVVNLLVGLIKSEIRKEMISGFDFYGIIKKLSDIVNYYPGDNEHIINFTGGTKIMSVAAFDYFRENGLECVYIDTENRYLYWFKDKSEPEKQKLQMKISLKDYFTLKGQKYTVPGKTPDNKLEEDKDKLSSLIGSEFGYFRHFFLDFSKKYDDQKIEDSFLIQYAVDSEKKKPISGSEILYVNNTLKIKLSLFQKTRFEAVYNNKEMLRFLRGEWFERFVYMKLKEMGLFDSLYTNVEINWQAQDGKDNYGKNEIDIIGLYGIYPFIFEVKAGRSFNFSSKKGYAQVNAAINKLTMIKSNYCSTYSQLVFIFPERPTNPKLNERLKEANIKAFGIRDISKIRYMVDKTTVNL